MSHTDQVLQKPQKPKEQPAREDRSKQADGGAAPEQSDRQTAPGEPDDTPDDATPDDATADNADDSRSPADRRLKR